jgi:hypothetical protein
MVLSFYKNAKMELFWSLIAVADSYPDKKYYFPKWLERGEFVLN